MILRDRLACLSAGWDTDEKGLNSLAAMHPEDIEIAYACADDQWALFRKEVEGIENPYSKIPGFEALSAENIYDQAIQAVLELVKEK